MHEPTPTPVLIPNHQVTVLEALMTATAILADVNDTTAAAASLPATMSGQVLRGAMTAADAIAKAAPEDAARRGPLAAALVQGALHHLLAALALECAAAGLTTRELADTLADHQPPPPPPAPEAADRRITTALEG